MTDNRTPRQQQEARANRLLAMGVGGLLAVVALLVIIVNVVPGHASSAGGSGAVSGAPVMSAPLDSGAASAKKPKATASAVATPAPKPAASKPRPATKPKKVAAAPKPAPAPVVPPTLPEQMSHLPAATSQLVVITGAKLGAKSGTLALYEKRSGRWVQVMSVPANFGAKGLVDGVKRKQGNLQTPTGIWSMGSFVFGLHASAPAGTKMPYRAIKQNSYWSSERNSTYNTWVSHKVSGEHLITSDPQYEYAVNSGYNSPPNERVIGRGTAIFIHCAEPPGNPLGKYTHGCIAITPANMKELFAQLDPAKHPTCAIGTTRKGTATSIWAY